MLFPEIPKFDDDSAALARQRQDQLTKPSGSLGRLEDLSVQLAGITGIPRPRFRKKSVILMAGDHGVVQEGVSAYPQEVTQQMVINILSGGAAINVLARQAGASVIVVDIGMVTDCSHLPGLIKRKVGHGTQNIAQGPAMTYKQAEAAIQAGIEVVNQEVDHGLDLVATGEMGIGNTTPSSAITAVLTGLPVEDVTGRGTGVNDQSLALKIKIIQQAISLNKPDPGDAFDVLAKVGGFEIAGLAGVILGAASHRVPVVVDGFISGAAALIAAGMVPEIKPYLIASHQSVEIGHRTIWQKLGLCPLLDLKMCLGEGTGAVLAFHLIEAATRILDEMVTFADAGVSAKG